MTRQIGNVMGRAIHHPTKLTSDADLTLTLTRPQLLMLVGTGNLDGVDMDGDATVLQRLLGLTDQPDPDFAVVTP